MLVTKSAFLTKGCSWNTTLSFCKNPWPSGYLGAMWESRETANITPYFCTWSAASSLQSRSSNHCSAFQQTQLTWGGGTTSIWVITGTENPERILKCIVRQYLYWENQRGLDSIALQPPSNSDSLWFKRCCLNVYFSICSVPIQPPCFCLWLCGQTPSTKKNSQHRHTPITHRLLLYYKVVCL